MSVGLFLFRYVAFKSWMYSLLAQRIPRSYASTLAALLIMLTSFSNCLILNLIMFCTFLSNNVILISWNEDENWNNWTFLQITSCGKFMCSTYQQQTLHVVEFFYLYEWLNEQFYQRHAIKGIIDEWKVTKNQSRTNIFPVLGDNFYFECFKELVFPHLILDPGSVTSL